MTNKTSVAPSDAEIDAQWRESVEKHETTAAFVRDFALALLAKWGTPPDVGVEPVGWMWQHDETGRTGFVDPVPRRANPVLQGREDVNERLEPCNTMNTAKAARTA